MNLLIEQIQSATAPLCITGGNSKAFYAGACSGIPISTLAYTGIISYHPEELVITARAGTPLLEINQALTERGQMLAFEPPNFAATSTVGGMVACGFSGPARPWRGSLRDAVLGVRIINGKGEVLKFGGEVIKNVAGYDAARLMAGAFGSLGLILEASIRTMPLPAAEQTQILEMTRQQALPKLQKLSRSTLPVSAAAWHQEQLFVRFSGNPASVTAAVNTTGGEPLTDSNLWTKLNQQTLDFFDTDKDLWRLSLPPATADASIEGEQLLDWGGAQRWLSSDAGSAEINAIADAAGGHASLFRSADGSNSTFELPAALLPVHQRLKSAFDPQGIFNPGRLYQGL